MQGTVREWRGTYGFIQPEDRTHDLFVHFSHIVGDGDGYRKLEPGQRVEFDVTESERGLQAVSVEVIPDAEQDAA